MNTAATKPPRTAAATAARRVMSKEQIAEAKQMLRDGVHSGAVAAHFNVSFATIYMHALRPVRDEQTA